MIKIIPNLSIENAVEEAICFNDAGADAVSLFDNNCKTEEDFERNLVTVKAINDSIDIPIYACGGVKRFEDVKKYLYAGAAKVCVKTAAMKDTAIIKECIDRFGADRVIPVIDMDSVADVCSYADKLKEEGATTLYLVKSSIDNTYYEVVNKLKKMNLDVLVLSEGSDTATVAANFEKSNMSTLSLTSKDINVTELKLCLKSKGMKVNLFESAVPFSEFKLNDAGLIPVIVQDYKTDEVLMLAYMNEESYGKTLETGRMTYFSRSRNELWCKGDTSGHYQFVKSLMIDCDKDTILAKVKQIGAACHTGNHTCFYTDLAKKDYNDVNPLKVFVEEMDIILDRKANPKEGSYTNYLFDKGIDKILKKVGEEATEIVIAAKNPDPEELKYEISDFLYHMMVLMAERGVTWDDVTNALRERR